MPQLPPLEQFPYGPRRSLQKIFADKDLRDAWIADLEKQIDSTSPVWFADLRIDARESGITLSYAGGRGARSSRRSKSA